MSVHGCLLYSACVLIGPASKCERMWTLHEPNVPHISAASVHQKSVQLSCHKSVQRQCIECGCMHGADDGVHASHMGAPSQMWDGAICGRSAPEQYAHHTPKHVLAVLTASRLGALAAGWCVPCRLLVLQSGLQRKLPCSRAPHSTSSACTTSI